jgi:hypothetical protein
MVTGHFLRLRRRPRRLLIASFIVLIAGLLLATPSTMSVRSWLQAVATPCAAMEDATPAPTGEPNCSGVPGTPVARDGLTVTLISAKSVAGPNALSIIVVDEAGEPVTDATVTVNTRSLVMDHGVSTAVAVAGDEPGRYEVERVAMGMGGDWEAEVIVERPGEEPVSFLFVITMEGPSHGT